MREELRILGDRKGGLYRLLDRYQKGGATDEDLKAEIGEFNGDQLEALTRYIEQGGWSNSLKLRGTYDKFKEIVSETRAKALTASHVQAPVAMPQAPATPATPVVAPVAATSAPATPVTATISNMLAKEPQGAPEKSKPQKPQGIVARIGSFLGGNRDRRAPLSEPRAQVSRESHRPTEGRGHR